MTMTHSLVMFCPVESLAQGNRFMYQKGWQEDPDAVPADKQSFVVPLNPDGVEPATHFGMHSWVPERGLAQMLAEAEVAVPGILYQVYEIDAYRSNWQAALNKWGLQEIRASRRTR